MQKAKFVRNFFGFVTILLLTAVVMVRQSAGQTPLDGVIDLVERSGGYGFSAEITQYNIPTANPRTIGADITPEEIYITGHSNLDDGLFDMTLYAEGGSVLDHADGVAIKNDAQGRLWAAQGESDWQEVEDFSSAVIPAGDFLHFLAGAENVVEHAPETRNGIPFTRYTFDLDNIAFAKLMRDQLTAQLQSAGELPAGATLELSDTFTKMRGEGELWVGENGLPIQQINHIVFPEEDGFTVDSTIVVSFRDFNEVRTFTFWSPSPQTSTVIEQGIIALVITALAMIPVAVLLMRSNRRWVYNAVAFSCTLTMVVNQPLMAWQGATAHNRFEERRTQHETDSAEREIYQDASDNQETQWVRNLADVRSQVDSDQYSVISHAPEVSTQHPTPSTQHLATIDSDLDGLMDAEEVLIGTFVDDADSDDDGISDFKEIQGFSFAGETWYTNPLEPDTNNDGISDNAEWNSNLLDEPNAIHQTWDLDGDQIPDLFDRDNDGDGVPDHVDLSPFTAWNAEFSGNNPFSLQIDGLTNDAPTVVDLQIRPKNPDQLWYAFNPLNWPSDQHGNIRDLNDSPDDVQIVPMLEIIMPTAPFNLPLRDDPIVEMAYDNANAVGTTALRHIAGGVEVDYNFTAIGNYSFQINTGNCAAPGDVRATGAPLPGSVGTQFLSNGLLSVYTGEPHTLSLIDTLDEVAACVAIPLTPFDGNRVIDTDLLQTYGINVRSLTADHSSVAAYVPLSLIVDDPADLNSNDILPKIDTVRGGRVAFQAQMLYKTGANWGAAHQANLVWQVNVDLDEDCRNSGDECSTYEDRTTIVHVYENEPWQLTGMSLREERGVRSAIVHEIPGADPDLNDDGALVPLAASLTESFVAGRTDAAGTTRDLTIGEIARRWDDANAATVSLTDTLAITQPLNVETFQFTTLDEMLMKTGERSEELLQNEFEPFYSPTEPISPTLLYAYEWDFRSVNLDMQAHSPLVGINGSQMTIDLSDGAQARVTTIANISLQPYQFDSSESQWEAYAMDDWFEELERRYRPIIDTEATDSVQADGQMAFIQYFYATMQNGQQRTVQIGDDVIPARVKISDSDSTKIWKGTSTGIKQVYGKLIKTWVKQFIKAGTTNFFAALSDAYIIGNAKKLNALFGINQLDLSVKQKFGLMIGGVAIVIGLLVAELVLSTVGKFAKLDDATKKGVKIATIAVSLINKGWGLAKTIKSGLEAVATAATATKAADKLVFQLGALGVSDKMARAAKATAIIGLIVAVGISIISLIVQLTTGAAPPGSAASNLAGAVFTATIIVTVITTLIAAIPVVGQIIMAIIGIIDALLQLICHAGVNELKGLVPGSNSCFSLIGAFTEALVGIFYTSDIVFRFGGGNGVASGDAWPQLNNFEFTLQNPNDGFVQGNAVRFRADVGGSFAPKIPPGYDAAVAAFGQDNLRRTRISAEFSQTSRDLAPTQTPAWSFRDARSYLYTEYVWLLPPVVLQRNYTFQIATPSTIPVDSNYLPLDKAGINAWYHLPVFLNVGLDIPIYACTLGVFCNGDTTVQHISEPIANYPEFAVDILPATLDHFHARTWGVYYDPRVADTTSGLEEIFPDGVPPTGIAFTGDNDFDGDGLIAIAAGGVDINDFAWDTDGDTLPDAYEADLNFLGVGRGGNVSNMNRADSDLDGICDDDELIFGSDPGRVDSDGDGLTDAEEVWHRDCTTGAWSGGWLFIYGSGSVRVTSNPAVWDSDDDGMSDKLERDLHMGAPVIFPFHPQVQNDAPVTLGYEFAGSDRFFAPGETFVYTTTIQNSINRPYYAEGTFSRQLPNVMGGGTTFENFPALFDGASIAYAHQVTVDGGAATQIAPIQHGISATLLDSANNVVVGSDAFNFPETVNTTIDNDTPTSQLTRGLYVKAGSLDVVGGTASDPTSYIDRVEVEIDGSFVFTEVEGAEVWATNWLVPATEGRVPVRIRATDAVGNVQNPVTQMDAIVDGTAPVPASNLVDGAVIRPKTTLQRNAGIPLSGTVADPAIGSDPGSGVRDVLVKVEPLSLGWFTATVTNGNWEIVAPLSSIDSEGSVVADHSGSYTVTVRAIDTVGNSTEGSDLTVNVLLDDRAPEATIDSLIQRTDDSVTSQGYISQTEVISGNLVDPGAVSSGLAGVEVAFIPATSLDSLDDAALLFYLNEANGSRRFFDAAPGRNHATCRTINNRCPVGGVMGNYGDAQQFNGSSTVIEVPTAISARSTIAFWFEADNIDTGLFSLGTGFLGSAGHDADIYLVGGNVCVRMSSPVSEFCSAGTTYNGSGWHQAVLTLDPQEKPTLYVNGEFAAQANAPRTLSGHSTLYLGYSQQAAQPHLLGLLDEFAVYNGAFSAEQVETLYRPWRDADLAQTGATITETTWSLTVPAGLDGEYQIDLRASDLAGNRNDERRGTWNLWRGIIDTRPPELIFDLEYFGVNDTATTQVTVSAEDYALVSEGFSSPCGTPTIVEDNGTRRIEQSCVVNGHLSAEIALATACDSGGRCVGQQAERQGFFVAGEERYQGAGVPLDGYIYRRGFETGASSSQVLDWRAPVVGLDVDPLRNHLYWMTGQPDENMSLYRTNLDGTGLLQLNVDIENYQWQFRANGPLAMPPGVAVNANAGKLYYLDGRSLMSANLNMSGLTTLYTHNGSGCRDGERYPAFDPAIDTEKEKIYWIAHCISPIDVNYFDGNTTYVNDYPMQSEVWMANLDGSSAQRIHFTDYAIINAVQVANGMLYWINSGDDRTINLARNGQAGVFPHGIWSANLDGSNPTLTNIRARPFISTKSSGLEFDSLAQQAYVTGGGTVNQYNAATGASGNFMRLIDVLGNATTLARFPARTFSGTDVVVTMPGAGVSAEINGTRTLDVKIENVGALPAINGTLTAQLPAGATLVSSSLCATALSCALPPLFAADVVTVTLEVQFGGSSGPTQMGVSADFPPGVDDLLDNNSATRDIFVLAPATPTPAAGVPVAYSNNGGGLVWRTNLETGGVERLTGLNRDGNAFFDRDDQVHGVAIDWTDQHIYFSTNDGMILRGDLEGVPVDAFGAYDYDLIIFADYRLSQQVPQNIALVDSAETGERSLYFTINNQLMKQGVNPATPAVEVTTLSERPIRLIADNARGLLFWQTQYGTLYRINLDGSNETRIPVPATMRTFDIDPYNDHIYMLVGYGTYAANYQVVRANYDGAVFNDPDLTTIVQRVPGTLRGELFDTLLVDSVDGSIYFGDSTNQKMWKTNLDGSAQIEVGILPWGHTGRIEKTWVEATPSPTPIPVPTLTPIPTNTPPGWMPTPQPTPMPLPSPTPGGPPLASHLFYIEENEMQIRRAPVTGCADGSCAETVVTEPNTIEDVVVDSFNQKVYWVKNSFPSVIMRADLDGTNQELFYTCDLDPSISGCTSLAVDGGAGYLYVYDIGNIKRINMLDNSAPVIIHDALGYEMATSMVIDTEDNSLYWWAFEFGVDTTRLFRASAGGGGTVEELLVRDPSVDGIYVRFSNDMTIDSEHNRLYWTEEVFDDVFEDYVYALRRADTTCATLAECVDTLYDDDPSVWLRGVAADERSRRLFWSGDGSGILDGDTDGIITPTVNFIGDEATNSLELYYPESCATDSFEPNDGVTTAITGTVGLVSAGHDVFPRGDADWFVYELTSDTSYEFEIGLTGSGWITNDISAELYSFDGMTIVAQNDPNDSDPTHFTYIPTDPGIHYLRVSDRSTTYPDLLCGRQFEVRTTFEQLPPEPDAEPALPPNYLAPELGSAIFLTDTYGTLFGSAYAINSLNKLTVTLDGAPFYSTSWVSGTVTNTTWSTPWTPTEGVYTFTTQVSDWAGNVQTETVPTQTVIDFQPPTISINGATITGSQTISNSNIFVVTGNVADSAGIVDVAIVVDGVTVGSAEINGNTWSIPIGISNLDGGTTTIEATVTDIAGKIATDTTTVTVDIMPPVQPSPQLTFDGAPITGSVLITQPNPTLVLTWPAATDGSNAVTYYVGFTSDSLPILSALTAFNTPSTLSTTPPEASIIYAHMITVDGNGNQTATTVGPIFVDSAVVPDLVEDLSYDGWRDTGGSLQSVDREIGRSTLTQLSGLRAEQAFYFSFNPNILRFGWTGADWNTDGDLFIYYSSTGTGASGLYDPFGPSNITFPSGFLADGVIHVINSTTIELLTFDGVNWVVAHSFPVDKIGTGTTTDGAPTFDLLVDYILLEVNTGSSLDLLAVASEDDALKIWASAPDRNPLNSERVINSQAFGRNLDSFQLTQFLSIPVLAGPQIINANHYSGALLDISVESDADAIAVSYLASDLLDLLTPNQPLDSDGDGIPDVALPATTAPRPVQVGATVTYSATISNLGIETATGVVLLAEGTGLTVASPINVPDIPAGQSVVVPFSATVTGDNGAELRLTLDDDRHEPYEFAWHLHRVDDDAPNELAVSSPISFVVPFVQSFNGTVKDEVGVATVELELVNGSRAPVNAVCSVSDPLSGLWSCDVDLGDLAGVSYVDVRLRATDLFGNTSDWTAFERMIVDVEIPEVLFSAETSTALSDGVLSVGENLLSGSVTDNLNPTAVEICIDDGGAAPSCSIQLLSAADSWVLDVDLDSADFVTRTITWQGSDSVGNRSAIVEQTVIIDTVAPVISVTNALAEVDPSAMNTVVLSGTVADGSDAITVSIRIEDSNGMVTYETVPVVNGAWSFTLEGADPDMYQLTVEASDRAGNVSADGVYEVLAIDPTAVDLFSISVAPSYTISLTTPLLGGILLLLSLWLILKTARRRKE